MLLTIHIVFLDWHKRDWVLGRKQPNQMFDHSKPLLCTYHTIYRDIFHFHVIIHTVTSLYMYLPHRNIKDTTGMGWIFIMYVFIYSLWLNVKCSSSYTTAMLITKCQHYYPSGFLLTVPQNRDWLQKQQLGQAKWRP